MNELKTKTKTKTKQKNPHLTTELSDGEIKQISDAQMSKLHGIRELWTLGWGSRKERRESRPHLKGT